jgi:hypothetical protein
MRRFVLVKASPWVVVASLGGAVLLGALLALLFTDRDPGHTPTVLATAAVALLVAAITAVTTDRRQARQLAHERQSLDDQLAAEERRLANRFAHERIMQDLQELREIVDQAQLAAERLVDRKYASLQLLDDDPGRREEREELVDEWWSDHFAVMGIQGRLELRLGRGHRVVVAYEDAITDITNTFKELRRLANEGRHDQAAARSREGVENFERLVGIFTRQARGLIATAREIVEGRA